MPAFRRKTTTHLTGPSLLADFVAALTNRATAESAQYEAARTEQDTIQAINAAAPHNAVYVTPEDMTPAMQAAVARSSVDAHLKKVQAEQITAYTEQQLRKLELTARAKYIGRRARVTVLDPHFKPLESYWFNNRTGRESRGSLKFRTAKGFIEDLSLRNNVLILRPTMAHRLIIPERKFLIVYPINPSNLQPTVQLDLA